MGEVGGKDGHAGIMLRRPTGEKKRVVGRSLMATIHRAQRVVGSSLCVERAFRLKSGFIHQTVTPDLGGSASASL